MEKVIKTIRHIQVKNIAYCPNLFKTIIIHDREGEQPTFYDESDEIEYQKQIKTKELLKKIDFLLEFDFRLLIKLTTETNKRVVKKII